MTSELSRPVVVSKIRPQGLAVLVQATPEECAAVAARMDLPAINSLECQYRLTTAEDGVSVLAEGRLRAEVIRICVVSAEEFPALVEQDFSVRFVPAGTEQEHLDPDLPDEIPYAADTIDLGEATAEQLGLELDPYPRMDGAVMPAIDDDEPGPFAALARRTPAPDTAPRTGHKKMGAP